MKVLLVDDDPLVRETLTVALEAAGHSVQAAENGDIALRHLAGASPDVVVTDIIMPTREGVETIREVHRRYPALPIIAISGGGRLDAFSLLDVAEKFGAVATLAKPFRPQKLVELIDQVTSSD